MTPPAYLKRPSKGDQPLHALVRAKLHREGNLASASKPSEDHQSLSQNSDGTIQ